MSKDFIVFGKDVTITEVEMENPETSETETALLYHDVDDVNCDGDLLFFGESMPETDDEAEVLATNAYGCSV